VEFSELAAGIQNHRFDGWTNTAIADQITRMINGDGTGSIGTAVDALKAVATALAHTDQTLRAQLLELGVEWQSKAGGAAGQVFTEQAGFSQDATTKVAHAAEMVFEQGEAFNRTKYKLPDAETVRKGAGGFSLTDGLLSLIGFETDHARQVEAANDAKAQAQQALNEYAQQRMRLRLLERQEQLMREIAERRGLQISWTKPLDLPASPSDSTRGG